MEEELLYYYGFEYDNSLWLLANVDDRNAWKNWTTAKEEDLQHFFILSAEDIDNIEGMMPIEMDSFPFNIQRYLVKEIDPEFYEPEQESGCGCCETPCPDKK